MGDVELLALAPRRLGNRLGVGAALHDEGHPLAEAAADLVQDGASALVLDRVVEERRHRLILVAAVLEDERAHRHQVRHVGDAGALSGLP